MANIRRYGLTIKDDAIVITTRDNGTESVYTYDRAGRLFAGWVDQRFYRRGLDGRVVEKHTERQGPYRVPHRRTLSPREAEDFLDAAAQVAAGAQSALIQNEGGLLWSASAPPSSAEAARLAARAAAFDAREAESDAARFAAVYRPVGILPPDQYLALVVQLTEGCHWNRCTFCTFYRDQEFQVKSMADLEAHLRGVSGFLGEGASLRHSLFLGEANALCLPTEDLTPRLDLVRGWFTADGGTPRSVYSFLDVFTGRRKSAGEFAELGRRGLRRVYVGVESGDDALLRFLNKPQRSDHAVEMIRTLKASGLTVGVIVMAGVGGDRFAEAHVAHTLDLLNSLALGPSDLIYVSAFVDHPHADYDRAARAAGIRPLTPMETHAQVKSLRAGLGARSGGPRVARYDIGEFIY